MDKYCIDVLESFDRFKNIFPYFCTSFIKIILEYWRSYGANFDEKHQKTFSSENEAVSNFQFVIFCTKILRVPAIYSYVIYCITKIQLL